MNALFRDRFHYLRIEAVNGLLPEHSRTRKDCYGQNGLGRHSNIMISDNMLTAKSMDDVRRPRGGRGRRMSRPLGFAYRLIEEIFVPSMLTPAIKPC